MLFEKFADDYARLRPGYPSDLIVNLIHNLKINSTSLVLDLACGTGNLTNDLKRLVDAEIIGIDRSATMLKYNPTIARLNAVAEALPLRSGTFDTALVGQAFHWFDFNKVLNEFARILKPGAGFAIIWYRRARPGEGHRLKMDSLVRRYNPGYKPGFMDYNWPGIIGECSRFSRLKSFETRCTMKYAIDDYLKLQRTKSYIGDAMTAEDLSNWHSQATQMLITEYPDGIVRERMQYFYVSAVKAQGTN